MSPDERLVHLWRKYQRTNEQYIKSVEEAKTLKSQRKKEFEEMERYVQNIKQLSESKKKHVQSLEIENEKLTKQVKQLMMEREAYLKGNQAIADLLITEGMTEFDRANPHQYIEQLVKDRNKYLREKKELEEQYAEFQILKGGEINEVKQQAHEKSGRIKELEVKIQELKNEMKTKNESLEHTVEKLRADAEGKITKQLDENTSLKKAHEDSLKQLKGTFAREKQDYEETLKDLRKELEMEKTKLEESEQEREAGTCKMKIPQALEYTVCINLIPLPFISSKSP